MSQKEKTGFVISKEIEFSQSDVMTEDVSLLLEIMGFGQWDGPFNLSACDNGIQIELKMDKGSQDAISGTDAFSEKFRAVCSMAYTEGCNRILLSNKSDGHKMFSA